MNEGYYQNRQYRQQYQQQQRQHQYDNDYGYGNDEYYYSRQQQRQQPRHRRSTLPDGIRPYLTRGNFAFLISILVIYFFQRKDGFGRLLQARRDEQGVWSAFMDMLLEAHDYIVGYCQMIMELCRNLRCHLLANGDEWLHDFSMQDSPLSPSSSFLNTNDGPRAGSGRSTRRGGGMMRGVASLTSRMSSSSLADMPPLEEMDPIKLKQEQEGFDPYADFFKENTDPLPPAFLKDEDYPPGWLVYDPVLGVVSKEESDKYHKGLEAKKKQKQQNFEKEEESLKQQATSPALKEQQQQQQQEEQSLGQKQEESKVQKQAEEKSSTVTNSPAQANNSMPKASEMKSRNSIAANG